MVRYPNRRTTDFALKYLTLGHAYAAGHLFTSVADTNTKEVVLENPSEDTALYILEPTVRSGGQFYTKKIDNVTVDTEGDQVTLANKKTSSENTSIANAFSAGDNETGAISGGVDRPQITAGSGSNAANADPGESGDSGITDIIMPGDNMAIEAINQSGSPQDISIVANYVEVDLESV